MVPKHPRIMARPWRNTSAEDDAAAHALRAARTQTARLRDLGRKEPPRARATAAPLRRNRRLPRAL